MYLLKLLISWYFIVSCISLQAKCKNETKKIEAQLDRLVSKVSEKLCRKHKMSVAGFGHMMTNKKIKTVIVRFARKQGVMSIDECREIIVDCVLTMQNAINRNLIFEKVLDTFPIELSDTGIGIVVYNKDHSSIIHPNIKGILNHKNGILYYTCEPGTPGTKLDIDETYEEAFEKLKTCPCTYQYYQK